LMTKLHKEPANKFARTLLKTSRTPPQHQPESIHRRFARVSKMLASTV
jgi:hypothetical protein